MQGQDAAGNAAAQNLIAEWNVVMDAGEQYLRITGGPFGPTANRTAQFSLLVRCPLHQIVSLLSHEKVQLSNVDIPIQFREKRRHCETKISPDPNNLSSILPV